MTSENMQTDQPKDGYDLLPCAHCGAKANLHEQNDPEGYRHSVKCGACHVVTDRYLTPFAAVKGWNTRSPAHAGMKEALQTAADELDAASRRLVNVHAILARELAQAAANAHRAALRTAAEGK